MLRFATLPFVYHCLQASPEIENPISSSIASISLDLNPESREEAWKGTVRISKEQRSLFLKETGLTSFKLFARSTCSLIYIPLSFTSNIFNHTVQISRFSNCAPCVLFRHILVINAIILLFIIIDSKHVNTPSNILSSKIIDEKHCPMNSSVKRTLF